MNIHFKIKVFIFCDIVTSVNFYPKNYILTDQNRHVYFYNLLGKGIPSRFKVKTFDI